MTWIHNRMLLGAEFHQSVRHGFSLIAAGFGSFSLFEGFTLSEHAGSELPKTFALVMTVVGVIVILVAISHDQKMTHFIDEAEFGTDPAPALPDELRPIYLAAGAALLGIVSFVALLRLPS